MSQNYTIKPIVAYLRQIADIYVSHAGTDAAFRALNHSFECGRRLGETSTGYILGHPRCGKTETIKRFILEKTGIDSDLARGIRSQDPDGAGSVAHALPARLFEGNGVRIVYADMTNGVTPRLASQQILEQVFGYLKARSVTEATASVELIRHLVDHKIDMLIMDEAQQLFRGHGASGREKLASWLLSLENSAASSMVVVGSPSLREFLDNDPAANLRKGFVGELEPFMFTTDDEVLRFYNFLKAFVSALPMPIRGLQLGNGKIPTKHLEAIYFATRGRPGSLAKLFEEATYMAFDRNNGHAPSSYVMSDLELAFDASVLTDTQMKRVNPFRDPREKVKAVLSEESLSSAAMQSRRTRRRTFA